MIPRRVRYAILLAFVCHGLFILTARYRLSYDAFTHMLFADHYAKDWFSLWDTRWYAGFEIVSYPPLIHQLIALFIPLIGFDKAYALILWLVTTLYPLGIYAFSRIFAGKSVSSYAALASAVMLPIYVTAHIFGQLPFLAATFFALLGAAAIAKFLRNGGLHNFLLAISITTTTMAAHHATLLVQPFLVIALTIQQLNKNNWKNIFSKLFIFLIFAIPAGLAVIWPFWQWGMTQQMQVPIDHSSRHNFLIDSFATSIFFWPFYFPIGVIIPFLFYKWLRNFWGLQFAFIILFILGLGSTTPLPRVLFGKSWEWLTYDRFAFWASLILTPFFGILFIRFRKWIQDRFQLNLIPASLRGTFISTLTFSAFTCAAIGSWFTPIFSPIQPDPIDMQPIVDFLNEADHDQWRYLTFGFGDQFAYLNILTTATTIDGSYHTARTLPELRESGIAQIDTALWNIKGVSALGPILQKSQEHGVRWGFVNRNEYISELRKNGWVFIKFLKNGIQVWENPQAILPVRSQPPASNPFAAFSWGIFPMLSLVTTIALWTHSYYERKREKTIRRIYAFLIGLIPLSLSFSYYRVIGKFAHEQVYFTYDHALFFLSDGIVFVAVILWLAVQVSDHKFFQQKFSSTIKLLFALCCLITLSIFWSKDWHTSAYIALHFWLAFLLILSMYDWHESWNTAILGLCIALSFQAFTGIAGFVLQSTTFLDPLHLNWPGPLDSMTRGASILKLPDGQTFLRAYGTLPHPNILGGFILFCLIGPITLFLRKEKSNKLALILVILGCSTLALTFSRSAWLGVSVFLSILLLKSKAFNLKKVITLLFTVILAFGLTLVPIRELFISRTTAPATMTEEFSIVGRVWLIQRAVEYIQEKPFTGVGIGSFIIQLAERDGDKNYVEPVHNIPLLVLSELGIVGLGLLLTLTFLMIKNIFRANNPKTIMIGALLAGFGVIALFDHYFWSLAPGRLMLGLALGLWQVQIKSDEE